MWLKYAIPIPVTRFTGLTHVYVEVIIFALTSIWFFSTRRWGTRRPLRSSEPRHIAVVEAGVKSNVGAEEGAREMDFPSSQALAQLEIFSGDRIYPAAVRASVAYSVRVYDPWRYSRETRRPWIVKVGQLSETRVEGRMGEDTIRLRYSGIGRGVLLLPCLLRSRPGRSEKYLDETARGTRHIHSAA